MNTGLHFGVFNSFRILNLVNCTSIFDVGEQEDSLYAIEQDLVIQGNICFIGKTSSAGYINAIASEVVLFAEHAGNHSPSSLKVPLDHC